MHLMFVQLQVLTTVNRLYIYIGWIPYLHPSQAHKFKTVLQRFPQVGNLTEPVLAIYLTNGDDSALSFGQRYAGLGMLGFNSSRFECLHQ